MRPSVLPPSRPATTLRVPPPDSLDTLQVAARARLAAEEMLADIGQRIDRASERLDRLEAAIAGKPLFRAMVDAPAPAEAPRG